jgi:DNA-binding transcriptional LysR family regulator
VSEVDARRLEYFLAIVDHDGFGRAAAQLHIAQPSLSQAIAGLERELGVPLFHRVGRRVVLSDAGRELVPPARQVLRDLRTAHAVVESVKGVRRGRVELVTMPSPGVEPLATLLRDFGRHHPGVTVTAAAAFTVDDVVEAVRRGSSELGLAGASGPLRPPGVEVLELERQPFVLVGPPGPDFPPGDPVPRAALAGARLVVPPAGSLVRALVEQLRADGTDVHIVAEVAHRTSILPLVAQGVGLAVLPSAWAGLARRSGLDVVRLDLPARLHVVLLSRAAPLTPAARAFIAGARDHAARQQHDPLDRRRSSAADTNEEE